jgi:hypothetical protein
MTGQVPFAELKGDTEVVCQVVLYNRRPKQPAAWASMHHRSQELWQLLGRCWSWESMSRPSAFNLYKVVCTVLYYFREETC